MAKKETKEEKFAKIRKIELAISNNLFSICGVVTLTAMIMYLLQFFTRGGFPPPGIGFFYIFILALYSIHKEMLRWLEEKKVERQGEWFVYAWIFLTLTLYIVNFFTKDHFRFSETGEYVDTIREAAIITLEVCTIFVSTRLSKIIKVSLRKDERSK